jgi:eukaryotic-like serine/threonine-protein kinase
MPPDGQMFTDRYELGPEIGRGGMAEVFLARDRLLDRDVAVKVLSTGFATDPTFVARFRREAQSAASLNHPNIVAVYDWGEDGGNYFIVMEYVAGRTLREVLRTYERLPAMEATRIAAEIADALSFAHRNGVVHRDVKPGNVLLTAAGQVKVTDFGIARAEQSDDLTKTGLVMGTATYFSPEQAQGLDLDGRTDVYALGVVLYEMLTGVAPFIADNPVSVAYKQVREAPVPPSQVTSDVPGAMDRIVLTAMAKDPNRRYQSAEDLRADLLRFERGRPLVGGPNLPPVAPEPPTLASMPATPVHRPVATQPARPRRRWGAAVTVGIAFVLLLALIGVLLVQSDFGKTTAAGPKADVPIVVGQPFSQAEATLVGQHFKVVRVDDPNSDQVADQVLDQQPEAGSRVAKGSTVTLTVSSNTITVPDIIGKTTQEAAAIMQTKRLTPFFVERPAPDKTPGTVTETLPAAGTKVPKPPAGAPNTVITVYVAQEPPVAIPDVKGQDAAAATTTLNQAGFLTVTRTDTPSDTVPIGMVIGTDPPAGTLTQKSAPVKLLVSTGPDQIEVPNVVGQAQDAAASQLLGAGFGVLIQQVTSTPANKGKVISQSPPAGTKLKRLDNVTITVGI